MKRKKIKKIAKNIYQIENVLPEKVIKKIFSSLKIFFKFHKYLVN